MVRSESDWGHAMGDVVAVALPLFVIVVALGVIWRVFSKAPPGPRRRRLGWTAIVVGVCVMVAGFVTAVIGNRS